jgi:phosphoglycolate phosphatase
MSVRPRAILLDLDGTLIDSRPGIAASCVAALRALGHTPDAAFDVTSLIGVPLSQLIAQLLLRYNDDRIEAGTAAYRRHYAEIGLHMATVYPGIADTVRCLSVHANCFVVTAKRAMFARRIVASLEFADAIRATYGTGPDGTIDDKARLIAAVLASQRLDPHYTVMVGDRSHDVIGAHANNIPAVGVLWGYGSRDELATAGAETLVATPVELGTTLGQ